MLKRGEMAGKIELRRSGEKFRFVVLNSRGAKVAQSEQYENKAAAKRVLGSFAKLVADAEVVDATVAKADPAKS
jgi:uncharacterized protein YegP (UPF0339 family)